ncbi:sensor domain-containing phosphodiesterase [Aliidiomarina celeris]|uniref:sensor domain-containing phosphodiesterase n=1 Tax=Aliidiomarina celeris TaxID=2249428 RepID=UPI0018E5EDE2|nr:EAL domain-containing protein [Aliidiomarina celeris]
MQGRTEPQPRYFTWAALGLFTLLLAEWSRWFGIQGSETSAIWPPAGIFLGASLALGLRALWVLAPVMLLWSIGFQGMPLSMAIGGVLGLSIGTAVAHFLIVRSRKTIEPQHRLNHLPNLYFKGAVLGSGISALIGALTWRLTNPNVAEFNVQDIWLVYWLFEALGVILFAPLYLNLFRAPRIFIFEFIADLKTRRIQVWLALVVTALVMSVVLDSVGDGRYAPIFAFALFPLICWYAVEGRTSSLNLLIPIFAGIFVYFSLYNIAGLPTVNNFTDLLRILMQVGILAVMAQLVGAINRQRNDLLQRFRDLSEQDFLTGLANDRGIDTALRHAIDKEAESGKTQWLIFIQLPDIQAIKDLLGLEGAARVERSIAAQLKVACPDATLARINQGRFVVLQNADSPERIEQLAAELYHSLTDPNEKDDLATRLRISMGVVPINGTLSSPRQYLNAAAHASTIARSKALSLHWLANPEQVANSHFELTKRFERLKHAIEEDNLVLYAQEIRPLHANNGRLSFEILVRMRDSEGNILTPGEFLPAAEAFGMMPVLDRWVIENTMKFLAEQSPCIDKLQKCAINLSGASLSDPEFASFIGSCLQRYQVPPACITFEVTETEAIRNPAEALQFIHDVHELGCKVALDDFGTGLASFDYLRQYPFDELKIDGVFIKELIANDVDKSIVSAICQVAGAMKLQTVAEFVEDVSWSEVLAGLGVDFAQGYGIGKPQPLSDICHAAQQPAI